MKQLPDRRVALLDANVLFPFRKRDILLRFHHAGLFRARWTQRILDEWTVNLLERKPHLEPSVRPQRHAMRKQFAEALVTGYEQLIGALELPDADDRQSWPQPSAAARSMSSPTIWPTFRPRSSRNSTSRRSTPTSFCPGHTISIHPKRGVLRTLREAYSNPPFTPSEFVRDLTAKGLPRLAGQIRERQDELEGKAPRLR